MYISSIGGMQQQMRSMFTERFSSADADKSGGLDIKEFQTMTESSKVNPGINSQDAFAKIDTDGDGTVTESELGSFVQSKVQSKIQSMMSGGGLVNLLGSVGASDDSGSTDLLELLQNNSSN